MPAPTPTEVRRAQISAYVDRHLRPYGNVVGLVVLGSVAAGTAHGDSDIDAAVFMDPIDPYLVPAEAVWRPGDDRFESIFAAAADDAERVQLDLRRCDWPTWTDPQQPWPEPVRAEFSTGWLAFDRAGAVASLIRRRTTMADAERIARLDAAVTRLDQHLDPEKLRRRWNSLDPVVAHDRLQAAYDTLVDGVFAYHARWRPWRGREMDALVTLGWSPVGIDDHPYVTLAHGAEHASYLARAAALTRAFQRLLDRLRADGVYGADPVSEAFVRSHDEPGRAWNMSTWIREHELRYPRSVTP